MTVKDILNGHYKYVVTAFLTVLIAGVPVVGGWFVLQERVSGNAANIKQQEIMFREYCLKTDNKTIIADQNINAMDKALAVVSTKQDAVMVNQVQLQRDIDEIKRLLTKP